MRAKLVDLVLIPPTRQLCAHCSKLRESHQFGKCASGKTWFSPPALAGLRVGDVVYHEGKIENVPWTVVNTRASEAELVAPTGALLTIVKETIHKWMLLAL